MIRTISARQQATDITVASLFVVVCCFYTYQTYSLTLVDFAAAIGMGAALALRRFSPPLALIAAWLVAALQMLLAQDPGIADLAILPVLYSTAAHGGSALRWLGFASTFVGATIATLYVVTVPALRSYASPSIILNALRGGSTEEVLAAAQSTIIVFVGALSLFILSWVLGLLARAFLRSDASRAAQRAAENDRLLAEQAVAVEQERNRIARDMHDIVAHSLAVVIAQADGARYLYASSAVETAEDDLVEESLITIAATARGALADVRVLLNRLRHNETGAPQPGLGELDALLSHFQSSGLDVQRTASGVPLALGASRELAVYRIVQEALTNALRHGDRAQTITIAFDWRPAELVVSVTSGMSGPASRPGHGIAGMVERATLAGGTLSAAPDGSKFVVAARLPTLVMPPDPVTARPPVLGAQVGA